MDTYSVWEGHMDALRKKVATIRRKCERFGCDFHFAEIGEEIKEVEDTTRVNPVTGKHPIVRVRFIIVEAEGTAVLNDWTFVATVEHTKEGNIFTKALLDVEIPERYWNSKPVCEHCNSNRERKNTCIVMNTKTGEFKQVGNSCLMDFTHGMSASTAAWFASIRSVFEEAEQYDVSLGYGWRDRYFKTQDMLTFAAEVVRKWGYVKGDEPDSTKDRTYLYFRAYHGDFRLAREVVDECRDAMKEVGFDPHSEGAAKLASDALAWLDKQEARNDYMHNLKVVCALPDTTYNRIGLLVSLFPTYNRDLEVQAAREAEAQAESKSEFVGNPGDRIDVQVDSVWCITSWETCYGYRPETVYVWKITGTDGNIYTWKTSTYLSEDHPPVSIKGTVKEHKVFRDVKQTEITRCKVTQRAAADTSDYFEFI